MKVLVTGAQGQLGYDVCRRLTALGIEHRGIDLADLDITDECAVQAYVSDYAPDVIMHNAAYTAVDRAETEPALCRNVNANGTNYLAESAARAGAKFVYISTDYVFDGEKKGAYRPDDLPCPVSVYGSTKEEGERFVRAATDRHFIVRISWVFGLHGKNFVRTMLRLAETHDTLNVVCDQVGSPTYTADLAVLLCDMIRTEKYGTYHATNAGICSWYDFACEIFRQAGKDVRVVPVTTEEYLRMAPQQAKRPKNSVMEQDKLVRNGFALLPDWKDALARYLAQLRENHEA